MNLVPGDLYFVTFALSPSHIENVPRCRSYHRDKIRALCQLRSCVGARWYHRLRTKVRQPLDELLSPAGHRCIHDKYKTEEYMYLCFQYRQCRCIYCCFLQRRRTLASACIRLADPAHQKPPSSHQTRRSGDRRHAQVSIGTCRLAPHGQATTNRCGCPKANGFDDTESLRAISRQRKHDQLRDNALRCHMLSRSKRARSQPSRLSARG